VLLGAVGSRASQQNMGNQSLDWFKGKITGNQGFYHKIWGFPVNFPLNQSIEEPVGISN